MDKYRIDSHKLMYHVPRVNNWLDGKNIYPIYMETSPAGACNHRCLYCGLDFMKYKPRFYDTPIFRERLTEMGTLGLKSIMFAGEGEPFLHPHMAQIINHTKSAGIDAAVTSNGVLFTKEIADKCLADISWIKISINGATARTYTKIHRGKPDDFDKVMANMRYAADLRRRQNLKTALGMQLLLLPDNKDEAVMLAELAKDIGMDYLVIKPYSQHPQSETTIYKDIKYKDYEYLGEKLEKFDDNNFKVIFRIHAMKKWDEESKPYKKCLSFPFWSYIDSDGNVWGCSMFLGDDRFNYGNIFKQTFKEIWEGPKRKESLDWADENLDISKCRINCRMDEINKYLWDLKNPMEHVNFI